MIDYALKAKVIQEYDDVLRLQREFSRCGYLSTYTDVHIDEDYREALLDTVSSFISSDAEIWHEAEKINRAYYARVRRLKKRISLMLLTGTCHFVTLTFTDSILASTSAETRRRYVSRYLSSVGSEYCANIDFGSENGREHYHAVVKVDSIDSSPWDVNGFSNCKKIASALDFAPLAKYVSKLTNHAIKETTKCCRMIYSR